MYIIGMEQTLAYICAIGGLAGTEYKRENHLETLQTQIQAMQADSKNNNEAFRTQMQAMQAGFDSQLKALTESVNSWKGLWEASTQEIRELKMEIKELRVENDKLRTEILELKGQLKEHYKLA